MISRHGAGDDIDLLDQEAGYFKNWRHLSGAAAKEHCEPEDPPSKPRSWYPSGPSTPSENPQTPRLRPWSLTRGFSSSEVSRIYRQYLPSSPWKSPPSSPLSTSPKDQPETILQQPLHMPSSETLDVRLGSLTPFEENPRYFSHAVIAQDSKSKSLGTSQSYQTRKSSTLTEYQPTPSENALGQDDNLEPSSNGVDLSKRGSSAYSEIELTSQEPTKAFYRKKGKLSSWREQFSDRWTKRLMRRVTHGPKNRSKNKSKSLDSIVFFNSSREDPTCSAEILPESVEHHVSDAELCPLANSMETKHPKEHCKKLDVSPVSRLYSILRGELRKGLETLHQRSTSRSDTDLVHGIANQGTSESKKDSFSHDSQPEFLQRESDSSNPNLGITNDHESYQTVTETSRLASKASGIQKCMKNNLMQKNTSAFLPSEAVKIGTPPGSPRPGCLPRGLFSDQTCMGMPESAAPWTPNRVKLKGNVDTTLGVDREWFRMNLDHMSTEVVEASDVEIPEHLPSSPLCPRHPRHSSQGTARCFYHGRNRTSLDDFDPNLSHSVYT